jgi:hypothetical protein
VYLLKLTSDVDEDSSASPKNWQYPPNGIAEIFHTVPFLSVRLHSSLPNPMEKALTLTPKERATIKWPNSCTKTKTPRRTRKGMT